MKVLHLTASILVGLALACGGNGTRDSGSMGTPPTTAGVVVGVVGGTPAAPELNHQALGMNGATITMNGQFGTSAMVQPGMVMVGTTTPGGMGMGGSGMGYTMQTVQLMSSFMGRIQAIHPSPARLTVMGQTIQVNALTQLAQENQDGTYTSLTFTDFQVGDFVSVHGMPLSDGSFLATRVERRKPGSDTTQVGLMGQVASLNSTAKSFNLGAWTVNFASATVEGNPSNGTWVLVRGTVSGSQMTAAWMHAMEGMGSAGGDMGLRGPVLGLNTSAKTINLMFLTVNYSQATVIGTLSEGVMVEVQGTLATGSTTVLNATRVEVEVGGMGGGMGSGMSNQQTQGAMTALDLSANTLTVGGTTYWMDSATLILSHDTALSPAQLKVGDWVAVMGNSTRTDSSGHIYASRVEVMSSGGMGMGGGSLLGAVTSVNATAQTLVVNGYTVTVNGNTLYLSQGAPTSSAAFWGAVQPGRMVEVYGTLSGTTITASKLVLGGTGGMGSGM